MKRDLLLSDQSRAVDIGLLESARAFEARNADQIENDLALLAMKKAQMKRDSINREPFDLGHILTHPGAHCPGACQWTKNCC